LQFGSQRDQFSDIARLEALLVEQDRPDPEVLARLAGYRASATRVGRQRVT
jgi:hypothetical protein